MTTVTTPLGATQHLIPTDSAFPQARAYAEGRNAYMLGEAETANPYTADEALRYEWKRAYRVARGLDRFDYTIRKSAAYLEGHASRHAGAAADENPYEAAPDPTTALGRAGIRKALPGKEQEATDWRLGFRDASDEIGLKRYGGRVPQLGDFVQRRGRRRR